MSSNLKIVYVKKEVLMPYFGKWLRNGNEILVMVRSDLPKAMIEFILDHELFHNTDFSDEDPKEESWIENELEANWSAALRHPWGALLTVIYSLAPSRIKLYITRGKKGE